MPTTSYPHIEIRDDGTPVIEGTRIKIIHLAGSIVYHNYKAEDFHRDYPYLSMAQIHGALTYYFDHQESLKEELANRDSEYHQLRKKLEDTELQQRLHNLKTCDDQSGK